MSLYNLATYFFISIALVFLFVFAVIYDTWMATYRFFRPETPDEMRQREKDEWRLRI